MTAGRWFPEGTRVGVNAAVVQRDEKIFGEDAEESVPERWFRKGAGRIERMVFPVRSSSHIISSLARSLLTWSVV
jgi:cytochrome P450